jgi:probable phosphoglycerate mutase
MLRPVLLRAAATGALLATALPAADPLAALPPVPADGLRVYLVRHGQAYSNLDPEPDLPPDQLDRITELGRTQADAAGAALRGRGVVEVLSSPAGRARETAERIASALGVRPPRIERALRPLDLGRGPDGVPLDWDARIADWEAGRDPSPPGGESMEELGARVDRFVSALGQEPDRRGGTVVLVAHSEVLGAYLGRLRGTPPAKRYPPGFANGSLTVVDLAAGRAKEVLANHRPGTP